MSKLIEMNICEDLSESWMIEMDKRYSLAIKDYLISDDIPEDGANNIISNAAKTLGYCPNPYCDNTCKKTGIVIGKVQSGKTSNFIAITALAFDNGYDTVVVFGGTKNNLVKQNRDRIKEYFQATPEVIVLDTHELRAELTSDKIKSFIRAGKKVIIVSLKKSNQIDYIRENVFNESLADKPTLIIDDEGDEASLNTLVNKGKKSATYKAIEKLKDCLRRHCFISVTATPQANLLINTLDILSPDFGVLVEPGAGYCGLDVFHSNNDYVVPISNSESSLLDEGVPQSFWDALMLFFVACAIRKARGMKPGDKVSMLVHPSQLKVDHKIVKEKILGLLLYLREASRDRNDIAYESVKQVIAKAYNTYKEDGVDALPELAELEDDIIEAINCCGLHEVNGDNKPSNADDLYDYNIYVGGAMLGRGITFKGLTITYIIRTSKGLSSADTVQQRARWFGYKKKYIDLCRIYAVPKIVNEFSDIRDYEEDLWATVKLANMQGASFKSMSRIFVLSDGLRPTRPNVAKTERFVFTFWNKQRVFQDVPEYISNNETAISKFREKHACELKELRFGDGAPYTILSGICFDEVLEDLLNKIVFPQNSKLNNAVLQKLGVLLQRKEINPSVDIIWMRDGITSKHSVTSGKIPNYSVGRRPKDASLPSVYLGDDQQFVKDDVMQIQIHMIEDTVTSVVSPTIALYIPKTVIELLTNLIIQA